MQIESVLIDDRESINFPVSYPRSIERLDMCDFIIKMDDGREVGVERKQIATGDLFSSIHDGRLITQCAAMGRACEYAILWVDGSLERQGNMAEYGRTNVAGYKSAPQGSIHWNLLWSRLLDVQALGVYVWVDNQGFDNLARIAVAHVLRHEMKVARAKLEEPNPEENILTSVKGIGPSTARKLLARHGLVGAVQYLQKEGKI